MVVHAMISSTNLFQKYGNAVKLAAFSYATTAESRTKCCDICAKTEGCVLANYNKHGHECHLSDVEIAENIQSSHTLEDGWNLYFDTGNLIKNISRKVCIVYLENHMLFRMILRILN